MLITRIALLLVVATSLTSCLITCSAELRFAITGLVVDSNGDAVAPTLVTTMVNGRSEGCQIVDNHYACFERGEGVYKVRIEVDSFVEEMDFFISANECHIEESFVHDVTVP